MYQIRKMNDEDRSFIFATWLRCYKHDSPLTKYIRRDLFFARHKAVIEKILASCEVDVACDGNDKDLIFGYIAHEKGIIHFVYVKEPFRKLGIAKKLWQGVKNYKDCQTSHLTYSLLDLWTANIINCEFNPYLLGDL